MASMDLNEFVSKNKMHSTIIALFLLFIVLRGFFQTGLYVFFLRDYLIKNKSAMQADQYNPQCKENAPPAFDIAILKKNGDTIVECFYKKNGKKVEVYSISKRVKKVVYVSGFESKMISGIIFFGFILICAALVSKIIRTKSIMFWREDYSKNEEMVKIYGVIFFFGTILSQIIYLIITKGI